MTPQEKVLAVARAEVGYLEKASDKDLDEKTANAGTKNHTKYARDLDALGTYNGPKCGYAWCDVFVDWCFVMAFGWETAMKMLNQGKGSYGAGCTASANYYKAAGRFHTTGPQPGDQIFFTNDGKSANHTGLVVEVKGGRVYTIEGNTSGASGVVANGGGVCAKSYALTYKNIYGYGRPDWSLAKEKEETPMDDKTVITPAAPADWAKAAWDKARAAGVLDGTRPLDNITRQELAVVLDRLGLLEGGSV